MFCKQGVLRNFPKFTGKYLRLRPASLLKRGSYTGVFPWILQDFLEHHFCIWLSYVIRSRCSKNFLQNSRQNSCERLLLVLVRIGLVWPAANLLIFSRIDCKSVFKVLSHSTEMQFSTDIALMSTQPTY